MIVYRKSIVSDSDQFAIIHLKSFPKFFLTTLGYSFLKTFYKTCIKSNEIISICAIDDLTNKLVGFSIGCLNSKGFYKRLIYLNSRAYLFQTIILFFTNPKALIRLFKNLVKSDHVKDNGNYAELLSICVLPEKNRLGIGQNLLAKFESNVREKGIKKITLTTDADYNDNVLRFYKKSGYEIFYDFIAYPNRKMMKLIKK